MPIWEAVAGEAAKAVTASVSGVALTGSGTLLRLLWRRLPFAMSHSKTDPDTLVRLLIEQIERDPEFAAELQRVLSELGKGPSGAVGILPPALYFDRDEARARVAEPGVWLVAGGPGTGKTAFIAQVSVDAADRYPDGRVYLNVEQYRTGGALMAAEAKKAVLRQLGIGPVDLPERELDSQYVGALLHRKFVLMIDNVLDRSEAASLAHPWLESLVLVTTRHLTEDLRLWSTTPPVMLLGLDEAGASALLASRCGHAILDADPRQVAELLEQCDRMPFAIEQVGVWLSRRAGEPGAVGEVLAEMRTAVSSGTTVIGHCLSRTFTALTPSASGAVVIFGAHPGPDLTRASASAMLGQPAGPALDELVDACVMTRSPAGRFQLHRLAREYAAGVARRNGAGLETGFGRALTFYRDTTVAADLAQGYRLRRYLIPAGLQWSVPGISPIDWLEAEAQVIADLIRQAHERQYHVEVTQLCGPLEVLLTNRGHHGLCLAANEFGIRSARALRDPLLEARLHAMQGRIYTLMHQFDRADAALATAADLIKGTSDPELSSSTHEFLARLAEESAPYAPVADYGPAVGHLQYCVELDQLRQDTAQDADAVHAARVSLGLHLRMLANVMVKAGQAGSADALLLRATEYTFSTRNTARLHMVRARVYTALSRTEHARTEIGLARDLAKQAGATQYNFELAEIEAEIAVEAGDTETARRVLSWLANSCWPSGHPRINAYLARLSQLPPPPR